MRKKTALLALLPVLGLLAGWGCSTNTQGDSATPIFLTVEFKDQPGFVNVANSAVLQVRTVIVRSVLKQPASSTQFLDTILDDYVVEWKRLEGGTIVPATQVFAEGGIIPAGGTLTLNNFPFMSADALIRPPLDQLFPFNGGIDRETGKAEIRLAAVVTFRGHLSSGQPVTGTNQFGIIFTYTPLAARGR